MATPKILCFSWQVIKPPKFWRKLLATPLSRILSLKQFIKFPNRWGKQGLETLLSQYVPLKKLHCNKYEYGEGEGRKKNERKTICCSNKSKQKHARKRPTFFSLLDHE